MNTPRIGTIVGSLTLAVTILGAQAGAVSAQTPAHAAPTAARYSFQSIANPHDRTFTQLLGINDRNEIAGYYGSGQTVKGVLHPNKGFTLKLPNATAENYPGSMQTQVIAINRFGNTAGFYVDHKGNTHAFWDRAGHFTNTDMPGTTFNQILGINSNGQSAGYFQDAAGQDHGYVREADGSFLVLPVANSQATGINDSGTIVGFTQPTTSTASGFILDNTGLRHDMLTKLNYPGSTFTQALGENNAGQVVGTYNDAKGNPHGFIYDNGAFHSIDVPSASGTVVNGINDAGRIVGFYMDKAGNTIGLVGTPM